MEENNITGEIVVYQPDEITRLEVRVEDETVWLTQEQIAQLFDVKRPAITKHIGNIFSTQELDENSVCSILERTAADGKTYKTKFFNLDMILSVGYRVNSRNAVNFRRWASKILKDYLLKGYSINARLISVEKQLADQRVVLERHTKSIEFFVRTSLPPVEGIFYDGQIFDAYVFVPLKNSYPSTKTTIFVLLKRKNCLQRTKMAVFVLLSPGQVNGCNIFRHYAV